MSDNHVGIVVQAAKEEFVELGEGCFGYSTVEVDFVSREFIQSLSQMKKVAST